MRQDVIDERLIAGAPDGTLLWAAPAVTPGPGEGLAVGKLLANGGVDTSFGVAGLRLVPGGSGPSPEGALDVALRLERRADGGADLLASRENGPLGALAVRLTNSGALDPSYSTDGMALLSTNGARVAGATMQGDRALFAEVVGTSTALIRFNSAGATDSAFGPGGIRTLSTPYFAEFAQAGRNLLVDAPDGALFAISVDVAPAGESPGVDLELAKVMTEQSTPDAPTGVSPVGGDQAATVSWTPPADDGGASITAYTVTASPGGSTCGAIPPVTTCEVTGLTNGVGHTFTVTATNSAGTGPPSAPSPSVTPAIGAGAFVPLAAPQRIADSRIPNGDTADEREERFGPIPGGSTRAIPVAGRVGLPTTVKSVVLTVAVITPGNGGYLTVYPCGAPRPLASSMNFSKGVTLANTVIAKLGSGGANDGKVCVFANTATNVLVDVSGSLSTAAYSALPAPQRIVDSRIPNGDTADEQQERFGPIPGGSTRAVPVAGRVGLPGDVENVVLTVAVIAPPSSGYLTIFPCGSPRPLASSLNFTKGVTLANTVITKLGTSGASDGKVCIFANTATNVAVDVSGSITSAAYAALPAPQRIVDSRIPNGDTADEQQERFGPIPAGTTRAVPVAGRVGLASNVEKVVLTVAVITPPSSGYLTIFPCGSPRPLASSLNFTKGTTLANTVITKLGTSGPSAGKVCIFANAATNVIVDVGGALT
jgi:hypothetical protein